MILSCCRAFLGASVPCNNSTPPPLTLPVRRSYLLINNALFRCYLGRPAAGTYICLCANIPEPSLLNLRPHLHYC